MTLDDVSYNFAILFCFSLGVMEPFAGLVAGCCFPPFPFAYVYYPGRRPVAYSLGLDFSAHLLTCSHLSTRAFGDTLWGCKFLPPLQRLMVVDRRI